MNIGSSVSNNKTHKGKPRRKKNTNVACIHCSRCHLSCDSNRPCRRCIDKGISETCVDAPRKRHKYLLGVPNNILPVAMQNDSTIIPSNRSLLSIKNQSADANVNANSSSSNPLSPMSSYPQYQSQNVAVEKQHFYKPQHIIHKSKFLSNAADVEYSMLSNMIQQDGLFNKIPVDNILYHDPIDNNNNNNNNTPTPTPTPTPIPIPTNNKNSINNSSNSTSVSILNILSPRPSEVALLSSAYQQQISSNTSTTSNSSPINENVSIKRSPYKTDPQQTANATMNIINVPTQQYPSVFQNVYSILLGPHSDSILSSKINLFTHHFPLIPVESNPPGNNSLSFKRLIALDPRYKHSHLQKNNKINQIYLNTETTTFPEVATKYLNSNIKNRSRLSFALECNSPEITNIKNNPEWEHSLRYSTPMEIYTMINKPFSHTAGFHHLLMYLRSRFNKKDIIEICRSMAEFRPIFIACSVTLTEEDMIFMEQCYQRTLLEYAKFLEQIGTPTCIWRRNGQISYINEEFEILTGWTREELLNKMTFIVEILDDESVRDYFKTFSSVAYKDFKGSEYMRTCRILSPIKGNIIDCRCMWTLKRDISGLPLMILGNFMPIL
ncbi:Ert1p PWA37_004990 [Arxiozyma heterogenica]|uniref:Ert1p n=1 Tax=Arxiozyma heterogenica TaxID=278026 RepID=UPI002EEE48D4